MVEGLPYFIEIDAENPCIQLEAWCTENAGKRDLIEAAPVVREGFEWECGENLDLPVPYSVPVWQGAAEVGGKYHEPMGRICFSGIGRAPPLATSSLREWFFRICVKPTTPMPTPAGIAYHSVFVFRRASPSLLKKDCRCCCCWPPWSFRRRTRGSVAGRCVGICRSEGDSRIGNRHTTLMVCVGRGIVNSRLMSESTFCSCLLGIFDDVSLA